MTAIPVSDGPCPAKIHLTCKIVALAVLSPAQGGENKNIDKFLIQFKEEHMHCPQKDTFSYSTSMRPLPMLQT